MNKIINDLLNTNARVIIPDFGAFIIKQKSPRLIVFNEFLRYNDGLLIDYISASEGINKDVAKGKVAKYVEEINSRLNTGEGIVFEGIGKLVKESNGKLTLVEITASDAVVQKKEKKSTAAKPTAEVEKDKTPKIAEDTKHPDATPKNIATAPPEPVKIKKDETVKETEPVEQKTEIELNVGKEEVKPPQPEKKITQKEEKVTVTPIKTAKETDTPVKKEPDVKPVEQKIKKTKSNTLQIVIWIILILVVNGLIISWFVFNDKITEMFSKNKKQATEEVIVTEEPLNIVSDEPADEIPPAEQVEEETTAPSVTPVDQPEVNASESPTVTSDRKLYYIVAGCFRDEGNADNLVKELQQNGYKARKFGMIGNLHAVSFNAYTEKADALAELKNIRNSGNPEAWIIYY
ncbi:MAG: SPOR domain-containing protein [Bacteroidales bacterium]|nr:SPOR domain-containing protein [Bacteroidales bacterium]